MIRLNPKGGAMSGFPLSIDEIYSPYLIRYKGSYPSILCNLYTTEKLGARILLSVAAILLSPAFFCKKDIDFVVGKRYFSKLNDKNLFAKNNKSPTDTTSMNSISPNRTSF